MSDFPRIPATPRPTILGPTGDDLRAGFGDALRGADTLDVALTRIRLGTLGPVPTLLRELRRIRVVLGRLRADELEAEAHALALRPAGRLRLHSLIQLLEGGATSIRAAPLGAWSPDFSITSAGEARIALIGSHAFGRGGPGDGPLLLARVGDGRAHWLAAEFNGIWDRAHDVTPRDRLDPSTGVAMGGGPAQGWIAREPRTRQAA